MKVKKKQDLKLSLSQTPSSGYTWLVVEQPDEFRAAHVEYISDGSGRAGARGTAVFTWGTHSVDAGVYDFVMGLRRGAQPAEETITFKVEVVD